MATVRSADSLRSSRSMPPCTMPNTDWVDSATGPSDAPGGRAEPSSAVRSRVSVSCPARGLKRQTGEAAPRHLPLVFLEILLAASGPAGRHFHGGAHPRALGRIFGALVKGHDDVGAESDLGGHCALRSENVGGPVQVRAKRYPLFVHL